MQSNQGNNPLLVVLLLAALAFLGFFVYCFTVAYPGGDHFIGIWAGMRAFLTGGTSPYSVEVHSSIATITADWAKPPAAQQFSFIYPFYSLMMFLPGALFGAYPIARSVWMVASILAVPATVLAGVRLVSWQPKPKMLIILLLFALLNVYTFTALINGNFAVFTALLVTMAFWAIKSGQDELAGLLLALSTSTPHLVGLLILFTTLWAISMRRNHLILWIYGGVALLVAGSWLINSDWILEYIQALRRYYSLEGVFTPGHAFQAWWPGFGAQMGWILTISLGLLLLVEWWLAYGKGFRWFLWTASLTLVVGQLVGVRMDPSSMVVLLFPLVLTFAFWETRWGARFGWVAVLIPLLALIGLWAFVWKDISSFAYPTSPPVLFFSLPILTLFGLYWVRWLAIRVQIPYLNELRMRGDI